MENSVRGGHEFDQTQALSMLLATMSAGGSAAECTRLLATGVPTLIPCDLSVLTIRQLEKWSCVLQADGELLPEPRIHPVLSDLDRLFHEASSRDRLLLSRADDVPSTRLLSPLFEAFDVQHVAVVPLRTLQQNLGMFFVGRRRGEQLSPKEVVLLQILAEHCALTLENFRLHDSLQEYSRNLEGLVKERTEQLHRSEGRLRLLLEINNTIIANLDRESLFRTVTEALREAIPCDRVSLALYDADRDVVTVSGLAGSTPDRFWPAGTEFRREESILHEVVDKKRPVVRRDLSTGPRTSQEEALFTEGILAYAAVPMMVKGRILGTLNVGSGSLDRDLVAEVDVLSEVANQVALAVENMLVYEEITNLKARLEQENLFLQEEIKTQRSEEIIGDSPAIRNLLNQIGLVAATDVSVLITGESGTGKELVAREIHKQSQRHDGPMIKVNCASIPKELYESEFFGHVKGAFTGAVKDRAGRFELAHGGTLFLDEVGEIPLELQSKLLRVLQDGQFERVGDEERREVDVRIIAATNRDLKVEMQKKRFREDLFYRLNVFPLDVAPLRQRQEDIPVLAAHFLEMACKRLNRARCNLTDVNLNQLRSYDWPGNVRELHNVVERALILSGSGELHFDLPTEFAAVGPHVATSASRHVGPIQTYADLKQHEKANVVAALERANWKIYGSGGAAEFLGIKPTTLVSRMKAMGIENPDHR